MITALFLKFYIKESQEIISQMQTCHQLQTLSTQLLRLSEYPSPVVAKDNDLYFRAT